jgi:thiol-disulfide isomerase/thioredoxin
MKTPTPVTTAERCNYKGIEVYFYYSPHCPHCERVKPYVDSLREKFKNVTFYYCNVENMSEVCYKYAYYAYYVPTVVVHADNITTSLIGERDVKSLGEVLKRLACCGR